MKNTNKNLKYIICTGLFLVGVMGIISLSRCIDESRDMIKRECENVDDYSVGDPNNVFRTGTSGGKVLGQFGCKGKSPYNSKSGYAKYNVQISDTCNLDIDIRYSCNNIHSISIRIYIDNEYEPRANFYPENTHDWNSFKNTGKINIGPVTAGSHSITFKTDGAMYGVADLDYFILSIQP